METQKTVLALNDLIVINNDRYYGYKTAISETRDEDLKDLFTFLSNQSRGFVNELKKFIPAGDAVKEGQTRNSGKLYRIWMNFRAAITDHDRKAILSSCEFGEDMAKKTYDDVIQNPGELSAQALIVIRKQREDLQNGHDSIKSLRDIIQ